MRATCTSTTAASVTRIVASMAMFLTLAACGYKGALYMPPPEAPDPALTQPPPAPQNMSEGPATSR
ncbi:MULTISPECIES: lipoprotein [unclassified Pusillimonas]|uniref:LPS translocon maturation chaperone LptM n=1 Tax=unclassified Pusillimonas TaxID=2640016 RepID=UPI000B9D13E8|nr:MULTISPECIES: lipoprotein [unclassified Pusillimonas]OXR48781.1 hypothetical protein PuT2_11015 [Pusillimonas sp. T2]ROT44129.1 hypothetical protein CHR62_14180 [Pusillimonas sp. NJUB218]